MSFQKKIGDIDETFYMRVCRKCNTNFFSTGKHVTLCWECLSGKYKKYFHGRSIKYLNYNKREIK